jgi:L-seryl-tRNA(Ser) seleniumtransferase
MGELLEHPRVKGLVQRVNRSTLAQRAAGFLDELRATMAERAGFVEIPSVAHLAERLAHRLLGEPVVGGPVINATGLVLGDPNLAPPLADQALHAMVQLAGEYHRCDASLRQHVERGLANLAGAEATFLASTFEGALTLVAAATAANSEMIIVGDLDSSGPIDWRWVAARAAAVPIPMPSGDLVRHRRTAIFRTPEAADAEYGIDLSTLAAKARNNDAFLIDVAPVAGIIDPRDYGLESIETINERLEAGAHLVIVDGGGLMSGPSCGIVVGQRRLIDLVERHPLASLLAADPLVVAACDAILQLDRESEAVSAVYQLPVWQLITAPIANLQQRAERLAVLMAESPAVASSQSRQVYSTWRRWGGRGWEASSWVISLRPAAGDAAVLREQLEHGLLPIAARELDGDVLLDLRSVFPRWDQQLVAAVDAIGRRGSNTKLPTPG